MCCIGFRLRLRQDYSLTFISLELPVFYQALHHIVIWDIVMIPLLLFVWLIWSCKCKLKLTWPHLVHIKCITSEMKLPIIMFVIRSNKAVPNWLAHFSKTQRRENPCETFEDNGRKARSCGIKQVLCSFCRSAINQFGFIDLRAVIPVVALFSDPTNQ